MARQARMLSAVPQHSCSVRQRLAASITAAMPDLRVPALEPVEWRSELPPLRAPRPSAGEDAPQPADWRPAGLPIQVRLRKSREKEAGGQRWLQDHRI